MSKVILSKSFIKDICKLSLNEDLLPSGDITSSLLKNNGKFDYEKLLNLE